MCVHEIIGIFHKNGKKNIIVLEISAKLFRTHNAEVHLPQA